MTDKEFEEALKACSKRDQLNSESQYFCPRDYEKGFRSGVEWYKEQLEKNRLAACDNQTEEEAEREQEFVSNHIEKNSCIPTFSDAIEYGMKLGKEQMIDKACEWLEEHLSDYWSQRVADPAEFINEFRKIIEK